MHQFTDEELELIRPAVSMNIDMFLDMTFEYVRDYNLAEAILNIDSESDRYTILRNVVDANLLCGVKTREQVIDAAHDTFNRAHGYRQLARRLGIDLNEPGYTKAES